MLKGRAVTKIEPWVQKWPGGGAPQTWRPAPRFLALPPHPTPELSRLGQVLQCPLALLRLPEELTSRSFQDGTSPWKPETESQTDLVSSPDSGCAALGRSPNQSGPQSPHL